MTLHTFRSARIGVGGGSSGPGALTVYIYTFRHVHTPQGVTVLKHVLFKILAV